MKPKFHPTLLINYYRTLHLSPWLNRTIKSVLRLLQKSHVIESSRFHDFSEVAQAKTILLSPKLNGLIEAVTQ